MNLLFTAPANEGLFMKTMDIYTSLPVWAMIGIPLLVAAAFLFGWRKISSSKPKQRKRQTKNAQPTTSQWLTVSTKAKVIGFIGALVFTVVAFGYMSREKKVTIQLIEATEANNGEKSVNVIALVDIMKIEIANSKNFEMSTNGEYSIKVLVGGSTPRVMITKTGTDNLIGGSYIDLPYEKDANMAHFGKALAEDVMNVIGEKSGLKFTPKTMQLPIRRTEASTSPSTGQEETQPSPAKAKPSPTPQTTKAVTKQLKGKY